MVPEAMVNYNDWLVAGIAFTGSLMALAVSIGPWSSPYRLRTIAAVVDRYGKSAARVFWLVIAIVSMLAGIAIVTGIRPSYARPQPPTFFPAR
jgi:hypothetical protein